MRTILFLIFIAVPLLELAVLIKIGQTAGFWTTLGLVIGMAMLGTYLLNRQGLAVVRRASEAMASGRPPVDAVLDSVFLFAAGLLLVTPGFISDALGLVLLIPPVRRQIAKLVVAKILASPNVDITTYRREERWQRPGGPDRQTEGNVVIETDFERLGEQTIDPRRTKGSGAGD